jgi:hypothetical protein
MSSIDRFRRFLKRLFNRPSHAETCMRRFGENCDC